MNQESRHASNAGSGALTLLGLIFITLKLCGVINWSWWWVTAPFWGGLALLAAALVILGLYLVFMLILAAVFDSK